MADYCPNYTDCTLVKTRRIVALESEKEKYISDYCLSENNYWNKCKRYITKSTLNFCPEFVLPDSPLSPQEIIDKYDNELNLY